MTNLNCPNGMPYTIKAGDSFFLIARTFGISLDSLLAANPGINPDRLFIGQVICVPTSTTPPPTTSPCPTLRLGSSGASVRELQTLLRNAGFDPGPIDGVFGSRTQSAVIAFQRSKGLTPDGIVGVLTWTALGVVCTPPATCPTGTTPYTIRSGDTFFTLAQRFNTTVEAIQRANPNVNPNNLVIGQVICIPTTTPPPPSTCPTGTFAYTIRSGDTFFILAQRYNTTVDAIQRANPTVNPNSLQIGQVICIPRT